MIFINSGHHLKDSGFVCNCGFAHGKEAEWNMKIRDEVKKLLPNAQYVPDELDLKATIEWINSRATNNDFALDIHLNSNINTAFTGTEAYYTETPRYADIFAKEISKSLGIFNRGSKHDSLTFVGSLGFLRKTICPSVVLECLYLTNSSDRKTLESGGTEKIARGIKSGLDILFPTLPQDTKKIIISLQQQILNLMSRILALLTKKK